MGADRAGSMLQDAHATLGKRLAKLKVDDESFSAVHLRKIMKQVEIVSWQLTTQMAEGLDDSVEDISSAVQEMLLQDLEAGAQEFAGLDLGTLGIDESSVLDATSYGARASIVREQLEAEKTGVKPPGVLTRYGQNTIDEFERVLRQSMITGASAEEGRDALIEQSPFLAGKPAWWADRLFRTESMGAFNRAAWEGMRDLHDQMTEDSDDPDNEGLIKILSATFDERTGWDSYQVHGQVRRLEEPFQWNTENGPQFYMTPPNRPNDREVVVQWSMKWGPIPRELQPVPIDRYIKAWRRQRKGAPPPRPPVTTIAGKGGERDDDD